MSGSTASGRVMEVPLSTIDLADERYRLGRGAAGAELRASLRAVGCLCPPICVSGGDSASLTIVAGFKRVRVLAELGDASATVRVRVLDEPAEQGATLRPLVIAAWDARRDGSLSPFACSRAIGCALALGVNRARIAAELLPALSLEPHESVLKRHRQLQRCPVALQDWLEQRGASLKRALRFVRLTAAQAQLLLELAERYHFSLRALEEAAAMLGDVARRDAIGWQEVAERAGLLGREAVAASKLALRALWRLRYPDWAAQQALAMRRARAVAAPERVSLSWDDRFERDGLTLSLEVTDAEQLRHDLEWLLDPNRLARLAELLESV